MKTTVQNLTAAFLGMILWIGLFSNAAQAQSKTFTSSTTFTVPHGVTSVSVECWGGGGKGGSTVSNGTETGGGGGGAYAKKNTVTVTPGSNQNVVVGLGSTTTAAGGDSYFISTSTILAKGGSSCANNSNNGAAGGSSSASIGDVKRAGGSGANGSSGNYGGGGGSSAGPNNAGVAATNATGATAPTGGGNGGNGRSSSNGNGTAGSVPGGGGGGVFSGNTGSFSGGNGANGQVIITWACSHSLTSAVGTDNQTVCLGGTIAPITYSMVGAYGATFSGLPTGITGTYTDGAISISGTATTSGVYNYTITPVNGCSSNVITGKITVLAPPTSLNAVASASSICMGSSVNLIASSSSNSSLSAIVLNENFNGSSNGWTTLNTSTGGTVANSAWTLRANGYSVSSETFTSNDASQFYITNSDAQGSGTTTATQLVSPAFSTVGLTEATLTFYHYYRYYDGNESGLVQISTDGSTWTTVAGPYTANQGAANAFALVSVNLNSYLGQPTVYVRFKYDATYDWYWAIDTVKVSGAYAVAPEATYSWTSVPAGFTSSLKNPTGITPATTTTYTVTATNSYGCSSTASVTVVVNAPLSYSSVTAGATELLANQTTTLQVNDLTGTDANVSWFTGANGSGDFLGTGAVLSNVGPGKYYAQITGACGTLPEQEITVYGLSNWTGAINTNWAVAGNWAENVVPTAYCKVTIGTAKTAEVMAQDAVAYQVTVQGTGVLTVKSGKNLTVTNAITTAAATNFVVESNANLIQIDPVVNTTAVTVKRKSAALKRLDYILWSAPVVGQNVLAFSPLTSVSPSSRFYTYNTTTNQYSSIAAPGSVNFEKAKGYLIRVPNNHPTTATIWNGQFTGVPNNGNVSFALTNSADATKRYNLVGNPYPSAISLAKFIDANQNNIKGTVYFWRKTNGAPNSSYWAISKYGYSSNGEGVNPNGIIQVGQGFLVEAKENATQVVFTNDMRVLNNANQMFKTTANETQSTGYDRYWLKMTNATGSYSQIMVGYFEGATQGVDEGFESKQITDGDILLSSVVEGGNYAIQGKSAPFEVNDVVPLSYTVTNSGNYTLSLDAFEGVFEGATEVYLTDAVTGTTVLLNDGAYTFTTDAGTFANRFSVHYQTVLSQTEITSNDAVTVKFVKGTLRVATESTLLKDVYVYDLTGKRVAYVAGIQASSIEVTDLPKNQVLIVKVVADDLRKTVKKVR